jgi:hypothetical protein
VWRAVAGIFAATGILAAVVVTLYLTHWPR